MGPFSPTSPTGMPSWAIGTAPDGNFSPVNVIGTTTTPEIGYGEGGYGEDGYDTPAQTIQAASTPIWNIGSLR